MKKILIIDDNQGDITLIKILINSNHNGHCFEFYEAEDNQKALELIKENNFYCCFVDYQLSVDTGLSFIKSVRDHELGSNIPIIIMTGVDNENIANEAINYGAQDYVVKNDMTTEVLVHSIENAVRTYDLQNQLHRSAHHDNLTGLINRGLFMDRLQKAIDQCDRYNHSCSLLYIDVDDFKKVNDTYGHEVGDLLLRKISERLQKNCRTTDSIARLGGDEFAVLLERIDEENSNMLAAKILKIASDPIEWGSQNIQVSLSLGISYYPNTANNIQDLLRQADEAMYIAKKSGKDNFCFFSEKQKKDWIRKCELEKLLPLAIKNNELSLRYQPIVNTKNQSLYGLEVLARWSPEGFTIPTLELMEMIDRLNLFDSFHLWLLDTALEQFHRWQQTNINLHLSLNIPANQCHVEKVINYLHEQLNHYQINPELIELEITETTLMSQPELSKNLLSSIQSKGVSIAIDDFGSGYSSMSYLTSLPVDTLKIDQSFIQGIGENNKNKMVIEAITALSHSLNLNVVAEGVETEMQYEEIKSIGCDLVQGFYFGRPAEGTPEWSQFINQFPDIK